jgi:Tol biopolymer transport system component/DNA-binding winged helix-turn-helix (wHTH) protein
MQGNQLGTKPVIRFGAFEADLHTQELRKHGIPLRLRGQSFQVLQMLLERGGDLVTREELRAALWPSDTFGDFDHGLHAAVSRLREVLGDSAESPHIIETLPRRGYRFIATVKENQAPQDSDKAQSPAEVVDNGSVPPMRIRPPAWRYAITSVAAVLLLGSAFFLIYGKMHSVATPRQRALTRITFDQGLQFGATWSPDGRFVAYSSDRGGKFDIWIQQVSGGDPVQITKGPGHNWQPEWSPDGKYIAYRSEDGDGGLFVIPALGGMGLARKIVSGGFFPRWSPDSSQILFRSTAASGENQFYVATLDGSAPREVLTRFSNRPLAARSAAWHPDGQRISIWAGSSEPLPTFWTVPVAGGEGVRSEIDPQILKQLGGVSATPEDGTGGDIKFSWMPSGRAIIFERTFRGVRNLWKLSIDPKTLKAYAIERLTIGSGLDTELALSADGRKIAFTMESDRIRAWVFPFDGTRGRITGAGQAVTSQGIEAWQPNLSRDGKKLAFMVLRAGKWELWEKSLADGKESPIEADDFNYIRSFPQWSPEGMRLAYVREQLGKPGSQLFVWSTETRAEVPLAPLNYNMEMLVNDWSPDGKQLLVAQETSDHLSQISTVSTIPLANSQPVPRRIAAQDNHYLWQPRFSPDARWVVFISQSIRLPHTESAIYVTSANGGPWIRVTDGKFWSDKPRWAPDGKTLYFLSREGGFYDVWGIRFDSVEGKVVGPRFRLTTFDSPSLMVPNDIGPVELSLNQNKLVLNLSEVSGSIWVLSDVDE